MHSSVAFSTRRNSEQTAENWRATIPYSYVDLVQTICGEVLRDLGYKAVDMEWLRNISRTVVSDIPNDLPHL